MSGADEDDNDAGAPAGEADADTIARATEMGWVAPENWKGTPPKQGFLDPAEFVRRGEKVMPLINARARKAEDRVAALEQELTTTRSEHRSNLDRIERMSRATLENQRSQLEAQYAAQKEYAVETGDKAAYKQAVKDEREATKAFDDRATEVEKPKPKPGDDKPQLPKQVAETIDAWLTDNAWFNSDPELNALANVHHQYLIKNQPGLTLSENLGKVREYVKKRFPDKFGAAEEGEDETPARGSRVEGSARLGGGRPTTQWSQVPQADRQLAERAGHLPFYLQSGETMEKDGAKAKERWAAKYLES